MTKSHESVPFAVAQYLVDAHELVGGLGHTDDQLLAVLQWHEFEVDKALTDVPNYVPHPDVMPDWSPTEIAVFEQAFGQYHKKFHKISQRVRRHWRVLDARRCSIEAAIRVCLGRPPSSNILYCVDSHQDDQTSSQVLLPMEDDAQV